MITFKFKEVWSPIFKSNVMAKTMIKKTSRIQILVGKQIDLKISGWF